MLAPAARRYILWKGVLAVFVAVWVVFGVVGFFYPLNEGIGLLANMFAWLLVGVWFVVWRLFVR